MPKLSVSVPDDLWGAATSRYPDLSPSHLVQTALRETVGDGAASYAPSRGELESSPDFQRVRERLARDARASFEAGFQAALRGFDEEGWTYEHLRYLAGRDWRPESVLWMTTASSAAMPSDDDELRNATLFEQFHDIGTLVAPGYRSDEHHSSPAFIEGRTTAFRMLFESLGGSATAARRVSRADPLQVEHPVLEGSGDG